MLDRTNYNFFTAITNDETNECDAFADILQPGTKVRTSNDIMCQAGGISRKAFVHVCELGSAEPVVAQAEAFLEVTEAFAHEPQFFVLCTLYSKVGDRVWTPKVGTVSLPTSRILRREVVYVEPCVPHLAHTSF